MGGFFELVIALLSLVIWAASLLDRVRWLFL